MMKIANLLKTENILHFASVESKWELIDDLLDQLIASYPPEHFDEKLRSAFYETVLEREKKSSTALGDGIAFPHGRVDGLNKPIIALATVDEGVDFNAADRKLVKIIFLFLFPGNRYDLGVKIQAVFARFLSRRESVDNILNAATKDDVHKLIEAAELAVDTPITAQDLMRNANIKLSEDMLLRDATRLMNDAGADVAPVVDEEGVLLGEVDCINLFKMELPDYMKKLNSVPPAHDFNPFSEYFAKDAVMTVGKVLNKDVATIKPDTYLLEIIFLLCVKKYSLVHVCENEKLIGVIDRITVLDKVFNL